MQNSVQKRGCLSRPIAYLKSKAYSRATYSLINYYTLDIKDPEIRGELERDRALNFDRLFSPILCVVIFQFALRLTFWLYNRANPKKNSYIASVVQSSIFVLWIIIWAVIRSRTKWLQYAPLIVFFPAVLISIIINLQLREMLPFWLQDDTFRHGEELTLIVLVVSMLINYNSFQLSVVAFPILYLISYEAIAEARVDRYYDPVSGEQLTNGEQLQF